MPVRPLLMALDGLDDVGLAYPASRETFRKLLLKSPIIDPLGRRVLIRYGRRGDPELSPDELEHCQPLDPPRYDEAGRLKDDCHHVCFKEAERNNNKFKVLPRPLFVAERAARIPLILETLLRPDKIHESPEPGDPFRQRYSAYYQTRTQGEFFVAIVRDPRPDSVEFITAYKLDNQRSIDQSRSGRQLYPHKEQPARKRRRG